MTTTTQTSRGLHSGKKMLVYPLFFNNNKLWLESKYINMLSLGVALSRGHGKYFFRGNVTIEEGKNLSIYYILL